MFIKPSRGWIGVDVGTGAVKIAQLARRRNGRVLIDAAIVPRQAVTDADTADVIRSAKDEISGALSLAHASLGRRAVGVASMATCEFHALSESSEQPTAQAVRRELLEVAPYGAQEFTFDSWRMSPGANDWGAISMPQTMADQTATDLTGCGLECVQIDSAATAIARALSMMAQPAGSTVAAVDWGYSGATLYLVRDGRPLYVRKFRKSSFATLVQQTSQTLRCSDTEATAMLMELNVPLCQRPQSGADTLAGKLVRPVLDNILNEIVRTLEYLQGPRRHQPPASLVLFGAGATIKSLPIWLNQQLKLPVAAWRPDPSRHSGLDNLPFPIVLLAPAMAASALAWE